MTVLLPAIAPVALIIVIGLIAAKTLSLEKQTLAQIIVYILAPALIADSLSQTTVSPIKAGLFFLGFILSSSILYLLVWALNRILALNSSQQKSFFAVILFANNGNLGLPLISFSLGSEGLERAVIYLICSSILLFCLGPALLKGEGFTAGIALLIKLPLVWAMVIGLILRLDLIHLSTSIEVALQQLGTAAIPVALIVLGMQLATTPLQVGKHELIATSMRLGIAPLVAYGIGAALGLSGIDLQVLVLQSAMPTAINTVVLVTEFGGDADLVSRTIVFSTLTCLFSLPVVLRLLSSV